LKDAVLLSLNVQLVNNVLRLTILVLPAQILTAVVLMLIAVLAEDVPKVQMELILANL